MVNANLQIVYPPQIPEQRLALRRGASEITFDSRIPFELASRLRDPVEVLRGYGYVGQNAFNLVASPVFQSELKRNLEQVIQGLTFRARAKLMAPDVLEHAYDLATDKDVSSAVRLDAQKFIIKMADEEPREKKNDANNAFVLQINLGG
jgi:hypothetical protein